MSKIRLIWDFRGPTAAGIAAHHEKHLAEFARKQELAFYETGCDSHNEVFYSAWIVVEEPHMIALRDALRPHRGERLSTGG
jgi:hypothetical protein